MNQKEAVLIQCWGAGDILFCQSIAQRYINEGYKVRWPIVEHYREGFQSAYPDIAFEREKDWAFDTFHIKRLGEVQGKLIVPLRWADQILKRLYKECMSSKYEMVGMKWEQWRNHAMWVRNEEREQELKNLVGATGQYILINKRFGTNAEHTVTLENTEYWGGIKTIEMTSIPGYSLFDWTAVILGAREIHTVSTSLLYIMEMLPLTCPIHLYVRKPIEKDFSFVEYIFTKDYILHY